MGEKLVAKVFKVKTLTSRQIDEMFAVFFKYYDSVSIDVFISDLFKKDDVILLLEKKTSIVKGFTTIINYKFKVGGREIRGIFSGDTVMEREYWGGTTLQFAFSKYMLLKRLRRPFSPLYWFLISKGYKTYLLMANNFIEHYPRFDRDIPADRKEIMDTFAGALYPDHYNPVKGLIEFGAGHDHLRENVAPITEEMKAKNPAIRFFSEVNQDWKLGTELVCLARYDLGTPFRYGFKALQKSLRLNLRIQEFFKSKIQRL